MILTSVSKYLNIKFAACCKKIIIYDFDFIFILVIDNANLLLPEEFASKKVTNKLLQQIQDPLVLSSGALPAWCEELNHSCPFLFPFETRQLYFSCTAFGPSR